MLSLRRIAAMIVVQHARVEAGQLVLSEALPLPDGTPVRVSIEVIEPTREPPGPDDDVDFSTEPYFGTWAGRADMRDSVAWVNRQRDAWT
jgi:hypothetical protein